MKIITILLIVHIFDGWGGAELIKEESLSFQKQFSGQTFTLYQYDFQKGPGKKVLSLCGEYAGDIKNKEVTICGIYFGACVSNSVASVSEGGAKKLIIPMKLVAHSSKRTLYDHMYDNFNGNKERFIFEYLIPYFSRLTMRKFNCKILNNTVIVEFED